MAKEIARRKRVRRGAGEGIAKSKAGFAPKQSRKRSARPLARKQVKSARPGSDAVATNVSGVPSETV